MTTHVIFGEFNSNSGFQAGSITGDVHVYIQANFPLARPETPPSASIVIPFGRHSSFIGRDTLFRELEGRCAVLNSRTALVGFGGVGKSQLGIEYAWRIRSRAPQRWVFWVHASNAVQMRQSYQAIADFLKLAGRRDPGVNIFQLVCDWLRDEKHGEWLLIFDNVDDADFLFQDDDTRPQSGPLESYIPHSQKGSVLFTSRSREAARRLVDENQIIHVTVMDKAESIALILKKLKYDADVDDVSELAEALEYVPLAIVQASALIYQHAPRYSVHKYLDNFRASDQNKSSLLAFKTAVMRRDRDANNSVILSWHMSFQEIRQKRRSAANLLSLMSFFDRQGIPEALLRKPGSRGVWEDEGMVQTHGDVESLGHPGLNEIEAINADDSFEQDISTLRDYSFISTSTDGSGFEMHGLVQLATRTWLEEQRSQKTWSHMFVIALCQTAPKIVTSETWAAWRTTIPHVRAAMSCKPACLKRSHAIEWAQLLGNTGLALNALGSPIEATDLLEKALQALIDIGHEETTLALLPPFKLELALIYHRLERDSEAEEQSRQLLELCKNKGAVLNIEQEALRRYRFDCIRALIANLASKDRLEEAEKMLEDLSQDVVGSTCEDDYSRLCIMQNQAYVRYRQKRFVEAEALLLKVMALTESVCEPDAANEYATQIDLASIWHAQGRYDEAVASTRTASQELTRLLGDSHYITRDALKSLATFERGAALGTNKRQSKIAQGENHLNTRAIRGTVHTSRVGGWWQRLLGKSSRI